MQKLIPSLPSQLSLSLLPRTRLQMTGWHRSQNTSSLVISLKWKQLHSQLKTLHDTSALEFPTTTNIHRKCKSQSLHPSLISNQTCTLFLWLHSWTKSSISDARWVYHWVSYFHFCCKGKHLYQKQLKAEEFHSSYVPGYRPSLQRRHNSRALKPPVISHPKPRAERDGFVYAFYLASFLYSYIIRGPTPRNSVPHIQAWSSQINKQWKQSHTDMPMGQLDLDDPSLKHPSQTALGYVKLTN